MSTKTQSLTSEQIWGVPKPQFSTIKPVHVHETTRGKINESFTGQIDVFPEKGRSIKQARDKAEGAFTRARFEKSPQVDFFTAKKAMAETQQKEEAAQKKVWAQRSADERRRVVNASKGADAIDSQLDPELRKKEYLKRKEQENIKEAKLQARSKLLKKKEKRGSVMGKIALIGIPVAAALVGFFKKLPKIKP